MQNLIRNAIFSSNLQINITKRDFTSRIKNKKLNNF